MPMVSKEVTTTSVDSMDVLYVVFKFYHSLYEHKHRYRPYLTIPNLHSTSRRQKGPVEFSISLDGMHYLGGGCDSTFTYVEKESVNSEDIVTHQAPRRLRAVI